MDLHLSIANGFVSCRIYDKRDDFDFEIVNFPFLDGDVPRAASYGVYISQLRRFARVSSHITDFNTRNKLLTAKLLNQGYRYHKLRKINVKKIAFGNKEHTTDQKMGVSVLLRLFISSNEVCNTAYAL